MITPGYAMTATERVLPSVNIEFTSAALDPRITFARTGNTATVVNSSGTIVAANANTPRFDYNFSTLACRGLLIEETRTNLLLNSVFAGGGAAPTSFTQLIGTGTSAPVTSTRTNTGTAYLQTATSQRPFFSQAITLANNTTYAVSIVVENVTGGLVNGAILGIVSQVPSFFANGVPVFSSSVAVPGVLTAVFTNTAGAGSYQCRIGIGPFAAFTGSVQFSCPQFELGAFSTSYIPTTTGTVQRNPDIATMTGTNFSSWWTATQGGAVVRAQPFGASAVYPAIQFDDATANNLIALRGNSANAELYIKATTDQVQINAGALTANTAYQLGGAWNTDSCAASLNGAAAGTDLSATMPVVTQARLGSDGTNYLNGYLQSLRYWPQRITNAEVQAFSK